MTNCTFAAVLGEVPDLLHLLSAGSGHERSSILSTLRDLASNADPRRSAAASAEIVASVDPILALLDEGTHEDRAAALALLAGLGTRGRALLPILRARAQSERDRDLRAALTEVIDALNR